MFLTSLFAAMALASSASAQADDGWDVTTDPARNLIAAGVQFDGGVGLTVQCEAGTLMVVLGGMPTVDASSRSFVTTRQDGATRTTYWNSMEGSPLLTSRAPRTARFVRQGGPVTFVSAPGEPHPSRMTINLPADPRGVDQVLAACGYAAVNPRDEVEPVGDLLVRLPLVPMPDSAFRAHRGRFQVELDCLIEAGRLSQCQSDHETPSDPVIGAELARSANGKRVRLTDVAAAEGRMVEIIVTSQGFGRDR